ncbi:helix-turn-helix domain-containing protein [Amycolatopsis sp. lyj-346]|uniref:helix-turn-helix domain-containing protein n=1 Tax=Amycolatopsis sp. lyj-346 TaxID=2789289 RepID=UPI00397BF34E
MTVEIDPAIVAELVDQYAAGETIERLVARYPFSYRKIRATLIDEGVTLRPPKIPLPPTPPGLVNAYNFGRSIRQLAASYGLSYNQTRNILLAEGVQLRTRGQCSTRREVSGARQN